MTKQKEKLPGRNDDNQILMSLQEKVLQGDEEARGRLWSHSLFCCKKIARFEKRKKGIHLSDEDIEDIASKAACSVMARFKRRPGYKVKSNFFCVLYLSVISAMFNCPKSERMTKEYLAALNSNASYYAGFLAAE